MMTPHPETGRATVRKLSIGYKAIQPRRLDGIDACRAYWASAGYQPTQADLERAEQGPIRLLTRIKLYEVSPVVSPANDLASISGVKGLESKSFADHSRRVVSAAREFSGAFVSFVERAEARAEARVKAGREFSRSNWQSLKELYDEHMAACESHKAICGRMKALLDRTDPDMRADAETANPLVDVDEASVMTDYAKIMLMTDITAA
jgi:Rod binding domain-containing protein